MDGLPFTQGTKRARIMAHVENLKPGMYIAVTKVAEPEISPWDNGLFMVRVQHKHCDHHIQLGRPLEILAIDLPFIGVHDGDGKFVIDYRYCSLKVLDRKFVAAMSHLRTEPTRDRIHRERSGGKRKRRRKEKPDPRTCPRCEHARVKRLWQPGSGIWVYHCPNCGLEDEPPVDPVD